MCKTDTVAGHHGEPPGTTMHRTPQHPNMPKQNSLAHSAFVKQSETPQLVTERNLFPPMPTYAVNAVDAVDAADGPVRRSTRFPSAKRPDLRPRDQTKRTRGEQGGEGAPGSHSLNFVRRIPSTSHCIIAWNLTETTHRRRLRLTGSCRPRSCFQQSWDTISALNCAWSNPTAEPAAGGRAEPFRLDAARYISLVIICARTI